MSGISNGRALAGYRASHEAEGTPLSGTRNVEAQLEKVRGRRPASSSGRPAGQISFSLSDVAKAALAIGAHAARRPLATFAVGALLGWVAGRMPATSHRARRRHTRWH